jgi:hypothetical protein
MVNRPCVLFVKNPMIIAGLESGIVIRNILSLPVDPEYDSLSIKTKFLLNSVFDSVDTIKTICQNLGS